jgi:hypothetical protein
MCSGTAANQLYSAQRKTAQSFGAAWSEHPEIMFEFETVLAFGVGASLVALAPMVKRMGNHQLSDSMSSVGKSMAKSGIKVGVTVAGVAGSAARNVARTAAEAAESFVDLVAEAKSELEESGTANPATTTAATPGKAITKVSVD